MSGIRMTIHSRFIRFAQHFYHQLMPQRCILCGYLTHSRYNLCSACQKELPSLPDCCIQCAQFLSGVSTLDVRCGLCQKHPPPFERTFALFPYQFPIVQLITQLKFQQQIHYANFFSDQFIQHIQAAWYQHRSLPDVIIPIPLHAHRLRERGFNQALEIAKPIAKYLRIPLDKDGIQRTKATAAQSGLSAKERKQNMSQAFTAIRSYQALSIAVIDDVITTGQTIMAFCQVLKQQGAKRIDVWCCARR